MEAISEIAAQLEALAQSPPKDSDARLNLYNAAKSLMVATEDPFNTICRINGSPMILTFCQVACDLKIFVRLAEAKHPLSSAFLAAPSGAEPVFLSRILRFLASNDIIQEAGEDEYVANGVTRTLARPGFQAGISHTFLAIMPCLQETPKFLAGTKYANPTDVLYSPFQIAHKTNKPSYVWATEQPELMANFNLWMTEQHQGQRTWLDVFDFAHHVSDSGPDTLIFVDVGGGIGQQCALLKKAHPQVPGRVVLQDQQFVLLHAIPVEGVEKQAFDLWEEQPLKGARIYYLRNILEDYPDDRAIEIIRNTMLAMTPDSLLVIDEMIIPNQHASQRSTLQDMTMMVSLASAERTERQWDALLDRAGLVVVQKTAYNTTTGESIIVTEPKGN
ncbi:S-adenosyl-L-methionine-dependent methyltransferase [Durotheca rogersii]|uniref:S-adenosyl-L-methionine-dependent methyltransferase n=1 Tax=Durotheca rogersii TaxID=419775 RepID=UPI0022210E85|nr:S-adenosyl-L-methionine-dependent methyltransferase [Durotheca rogersii]KAI5864895.1 S-adenosyl-L-methionine-dependent methyltransferase [Durotheca rogersii]